MYHFDFERFIEEKREEYIKMVKEIFEDMKEKKTYEQGLDDAWEAARKMCRPVKRGGMTPNDLIEIFGTPFTGGIILKNTAAEVIAKIKAYEEKQDEIKVGDEVFMNFTPSVIGIVTHIHSDGGAHIMWADGTAGEYNITNCGKTGRHFSQVEALLKAMKEK